MAAKMKLVKRYDCTVDPCPRKKPKYFVKHTEYGITLSREELTRAQAYFGDAASVNINNNVMCDAHLDRYRVLRGSLPFEDEVLAGAGTQNGHSEGSKGRRKEQICTRCGIPRKGHVCADTVPGRSAWAPPSSAAVAPVLTSKESRSLIQHLKPTLGKRKGEHPYPFTKHTAARSLFHIATDEQLKRGVRHDASILTRLFTRTVPFRQAGPYEVPPGPFVPNPAQPPPPPPRPAGIAALVAAANRSRSQFADQPEEQYFERYPIENDLRDMYRRHHAEIGEEIIDQ